MNLIDKKNIVFLQIRQQCSEISGFLNSWTGGDSHVDSHLIRNDLCHGGLAEAGRTIEQHMIERLVAHSGGVNKHLKIIFRLFLANIITDKARSE